MIKITADAKLFQKLKQKIDIMGVQIGIFKLCRNFSITMVVKCVLCFPHIKNRIEKVLHPSSSAFMIESFIYAT